MAEEVRHPFPTQPLPDESNEAFAERKRQWARQTSEWILTQKWIDYPYLPEHYNLKPLMEHSGSDKQDL